MDDRHYERRFNDLQERVDKIYDEIEVIEAEIEEIEIRIANVKSNRIKAEAIVDALKHFKMIS